MTREEPSIWRRIREGNGINRKGSREWGGHQGRAKLVLLKHIITERVSTFHVSPMQKSYIAKQKYIEKLRFID